MEKALEILEELLVDVKKDIEAEGIDGFGYIETQLEKSIVELEYAMKPKTCDGCKHRSHLNENLTNKITNGFCVENGFY